MTCPIAAQHTQSGLRGNVLALVAMFVVLAFPSRLAAAGGESSAGLGHVLFAFAILDRSKQIQ